METVSHLGQYNRQIIKIVTMKVFSLDQQPLFRISKILVPCCLALLVEAALQLLAWKMVTSIPAFNNSPLIHLDRVSDEEASLWGFPYVVVSLPWFLFILLFCSPRIWNNLQYIDFYFHWGCDSQKVVVDALGWFA